MLITAKYLLPTNTLGSRIKVSAKGFKPVTVARDYGRNIVYQTNDLIVEYVAANKMSGHLVIYDDGDITYGVLGSNWGAWDKGEAF